MSFPLLKFPKPAFRILVYFFLSMTTTFSQPNCPQRDSILPVYFPHEDCRKFWQCSNGVPYVFTCSGTLHFNPKLNNCDWPPSAGCKSIIDPTPSTTSSSKKPPISTTISSSSSVPSTATTTISTSTDTTSLITTIITSSTPVTTVTGSTSNASSSFSTVTSELPSSSDYSTISDSNSSSVTLSSIIPSTTSVITSSPSTLSSSSSTASSTSSSITTTTVSSSPDTSTTDSPTSSKSSSSASFSSTSAITEDTSTVITTSETFTTSELDSSTHTEITTEEITDEPSDSKEDVSTPETSTDSSSSSSIFISTTTPSTTTTEASSIDDVKYICEKLPEVYFLAPHPKNCSLYIACNYGITVIMNCPFGLQFNTQKQSCLEPEHSDCRTEISLYNKTKTENTDYICRIYEIAFLSHPMDCSKFIVCVYGKGRVLQCPDQKWYDAPSRQCVHPLNSTCTINRSIPIFRY